MTHFAWHFRIPQSQTEFDKLLMYGRDTVCPWPLGLIHSFLPYPTPPPSAGCGLLTLSLLHV